MAAGRFFVLSTLVLYLGVRQVRIAVDVALFPDDPYAPLKEGLKEAFPLFIGTWIVAYSFAESVDA